MSGKELAKTIIGSLDNGTKGVTNPASWHADAVFAIEYRMHDKQFPQVDHGVSAEYFRDEAALKAWIKAKEDFVKSTDYDFSIACQLYEWDWGPKLMRSFSL